MGKEIQFFSSSKLCCCFIQVVEGLYDCKSEVIGPGAYRFKAEIGMPISPLRWCFSAVFCYHLLDQFLHVFQHHFIYIIK